MLKRAGLLFLCFLVASTMLMGCKKEQNVESNDKLLWYARINKQTANEEVFQKANEMAKEKLGIGLDIVALEDYDTKIQVINASGEDYDIVYTSGTINNYYKNVGDENFLALDELLPKYAPKLNSMFGEDVWDAVRVDGKIYGVVNQQIAARAPCYYVPKQNVELLGLDKEKYANASLEDYEEYLRKVKEKTGSFTYMAGFFTGGGEQIYGMELVNGSNLPGAIRIDEENPKIINQYETEEFKNYIKLRAKWVQEGLTSPMHVTEADLPKYADTPEGEVVPWLGFCNTYMPGVENDYKISYGVDVEILTKSRPVMNGYSLTSTMSAINADTRFPEKSVEFMEMLHTDKDFYNLIAFGLEDKHYKKVSENRIEVIDADAYSQPVWAIGNMFNAYVIDGQEDNIWEETKKINDEAKRSPILGFSPDLDEIQLEVANCNTALDEYLDILNEGLMDVDTTYDAFIQKLKTAGCDEMIRKLNEQLDEWRSSK